MKPGKHQGWDIPLPNVALSTLSYRHGDFEDLSHFFEETLSRSSIPKGREMDLILERLEEDAVDWLRVEAPTIARESLYGEDLIDAITECDRQPAYPDEERDYLPILNELLWLDEEGALTPRADSAMTVLFGVDRIREAIEIGDAGESALQTWIVFASAMQSDHMELLASSFESKRRAQLMRQKGGKAAAARRREGVREKHERIAENARELLQSGRSPRDIASILAKRHELSERQIRNVLTAKGVRSSRKKTETS